MDVEVVCHVLRIVWVRLDSVGFSWSFCLQAVWVWPELLPVGF